MRRASGLVAHNDYACVDAVHLPSEIPSEYYALGSPARLPPQKTRAPLQLSPSPLRGTQQRVLTPTKVFELKMNQTHRKYVDDMVEGWSPFDRDCSLVYLLERAAYCNGNRDVPLRALDGRTIAKFTPNGKLLARE